MNSCDSCTDPLVFTAGDTGTVNGEGSTRSGVRVVDDIELMCGHHFHWSCFADAYSEGRRENRRTTCPRCHSNIIDTSTQQLLVTWRSELGEQTRFDLGSKLEEDEKKYSNLESKRVHVFLDTCQSGDNQAILGMLASHPSLIVSQDFETAQTCLHYAVRDGHYNTAMLLLAQGADRNAKDTSGKTFIDLARQLGASDDILLRLGSS